MIKEDIKVGCFQIILLLLLSINYLIVSMSHTLPVFQNYTPKFYCESSDGMNKSSSCNSNNLNSTDSNYCANDYIFVTENGERSIVTDWILICERSYLKDFSKLIYYLGVIIGSCISGIIMDRIGRLPVLAICLYSHGTMAVATYIVQSYPVFLALRGLQGAFTQGLQSSTYILTLELFPTNFRTLVSSIMGFAWTLGLFLLAILSYMIPDWRILQLAVSVPTAITVLYIWIIPDSPRWLLAKGKTTEYDIAVEKIAKYNSCCCINKSRKKLVSNNSENVTPVKTERKSRAFSHETEGEDENLLTPTISNSRNSRISLKAISQNLEKRLSNSVAETATATITEVSIENSAACSSNQSNETSKVSLSSEPNVQTKEMEDDIVEVVEEETVEIVNKSSENEKKDDNDSNNINNKMKKNKKEFEKILNHWHKLKNNDFLKYTVIISWQWLFLSIMNSSVIHFLPNLVNNRHINFVLDGMLELTIYLVIYFILSRHGRCLPMGVCQTLNSVICIMIVGLEFLPRITAVWIGLARTILLLLGRIISLSTFAIIHLYTVEIFPTVIRGTYFGLSVVIGTIASTTTPYILLTINNSTIGPFIFNGFMCLLSGFLCFILPETLNTPLPNHFNDIKSLKIIKNCDLNSIVNENDDSKREILREKLFSEDWVDAGNGIIVNFTENKN